MNGIVRQLRAGRDPVRAAAEKRYLKSDLDFYGLPLAVIRRVAREFHRANPEVTPARLRRVVTTLYAAPVFEQRMCAVEVLRAYLASLAPDDLPMIERMIRGAKTWALVDPLAGDIAGPLVERFPKMQGTLERWARDGDFWIRRSALLACLESVRRGGDFTRFARFADAMLEEKEFFIRKAIGWVLREAAKMRPELVAGWLRPRMARASGVTIREAVKYLSPEQRATLSHGSVGSHTGW